MKHQIRLRPPRLRAKTNLSLCNVITSQMYDIAAES